MKYQLTDTAGTVVKLLVKFSLKLLSVLSGKNEVTLEFHQHDDAEIALMEMRFYVPPNNDGTDADTVKVGMKWLRTVFKV
jgi:hypothetical protein